MTINKITYLIAEQPSYAAAYNRVRMLSEGLISNGIPTNIVLIPKTNAIDFYYYLKYCLFLFHCFIRLLFSTKKQVFILYGESSILKYLVRFPHKALLLSERTEYSTYLYKENISNSHIASIKEFENSLKYVDGMIVCSDALDLYYHNFTSKPFCIVPLVYEQNFIKQCNNKDNHTIVYCGDMGGGKDGVEILIRAFAIVSKSFTDYKLILIGGSEDKYVIEQLNRITLELGISEKTKFTGWVKREELPSYLENASLLALARPANKQAEGGIPSKLAEYLSTGRPVLTTRVGDLPKYFEDSENLFFASPGSVQDFALQMCRILNNYESSLDVGRKGAEAVKQFDKVLQASNIITYLNAIKR